VRLILRTPEQQGARYHVQALREDGTRCGDLVARGNQIRDETRLKVRSCTVLISNPHDFTKDSRIQILALMNECRDCTLTASFVVGLVGSRVCCVSTDLGYKERNESSRNRGVMESVGLQFRFAALVVVIVSNS
jgi:hypothetical protein